MCGLSSGQEGGPLQSPSSQAPVRSPKEERKFRTASSNQCHSVPRERSAPQTPCHGLLSLLCGSLGASPSRSFLLRGGPSGLGSGHPDGTSVTADPQPWVSPGEVASHQAGTHIQGPVAGGPQRTLDMPRGGGREGQGQGTRSWKARAHSPRADCRQVVWEDVWGDWDRGKGARKGT